MPLAVPHSRFHSLRVWTCLCALAAAAPVHAQTRVLLSFPDAHDVPGAIQKTAINETARIWAAYGITIDEGSIGSCDPSSTLAIPILVNHGFVEGADGLGAVHFGRNGAPDQAITVYYDAIVHLATSMPVGGLHPSLWPQALQDEVVARALGRALAHEIGHVLLRWPHHPAEGLMRAVYVASSLSSPERLGFGLTDVDVARLHIVLAASLPSHIFPNLAHAHC